jgi:hypothetical protein
MTLEQSEFQQLVELLAELINRYRRNPAALEAILGEFRDLYRKVPIYPSIVSLCLKKVIGPAKPDELREGENVVLSLRDGRIVSGKVVGVTPTGIELVGMRQLTTMPASERILIQKSEIGDAKRITREILKKEWPSLDFEV